MIHFCKLLDASTGQIERFLNPEDISEYRDAPDKVIWLDIKAPTVADMALLKQEFGFHHLALEDCLHSHQRPKLEEYAAFKFMVIYQAVLDGPDTRVEHRELELFLGSNYVVTVHREDVPVIAQIEQRWEQAESYGDDGANYLAYLLIDTVVDSYFPVLDAFSDRLEEMERQIFERFDGAVVADIFDLKKDILMLRRLVTPLRDVFLMLLRGQHQALSPRTYTLFQDVLDHLLRISDAIDTYRDLVSSALDAYMTMTANRTNETMKKLTVLSTVLMSMALIAGIYGMNFKHMPELNWPEGYYYSLGLMLAVAVILTALFRWRRYI